MMADNDPLCSGEIAFANTEPRACFEPADGFLCSLPAETPEEAAGFLDTLASGSALGTGTQMSRLGVQMPAIREAYEQEVQRMVAEVERRPRVNLRRR